MATVPIAAQTAKPPFTAIIGVENLGSQTGPNSYTVKTGSDVFIKVHLTNISKHKLSLGYDKDSISTKYATEMATWPRSERSTTRKLGRPDMDGRPASSSLAKAWTLPVTSSAGYLTWVS
jgi:hypothetical protein